MKASSLIERGMLVAAYHRNFYFPQLPPLFQSTFISSSLFRMPGMAGLNRLGKMTNMPAVQNEVLYAMQPELAPAGETEIKKFGAKDIHGSELEKFNGCL